MEARNANKNRFETANSNILYTSVNGGVALGEGEASAITAVPRERRWAATVLHHASSLGEGVGLPLPLCHPRLEEGGGPQCNR